MSSQNVRKGTNRATTQSDRLFCQRKNGATKSQLIRSSWKRGFVCAKASDNIRFYRNQKKGNLERICRRQFPVPFDQNSYRNRNGITLCCVAFCSIHHAIWWLSEETPTSVQQETRGEPNSREKDVFPWREVQIIDPGQSLHLSAQITILPLNHVEFFTGNTWQTKKLQVTRQVNFEQQNCLCHFEPTISSDRGLHSAGKSSFSIWRSSLAEMADVDPDTLLEWLSMGQGDERDMQLIALEQLCMLLLMSDNIDRCFERWEN